MRKTVQTGQVVWASSATDSLTVSHSPRNHLQGDHLWGQTSLANWTPDNQWDDEEEESTEKHGNRHRDIWRLHGVLTPPLWSFMVSSEGQAGWVSSSLLHSAYIGSAIIMNYVFSGSNYPCQILYEIPNWLSNESLPRKLTIKYMCVYILIHVCVKWPVLTFLTFPPFLSLPTGWVVFLHCMITAQTHKHPLKSALRLTRQRTSSFLHKA